MPKLRPLSNEEQDYIIKNKESMTYQAIADHIGCSNWKVIDFLKKKGLYLEEDNKTIKINNEMREIIIKMYKKGVTLKDIHTYITEHFDTDISYGGICLFYRRYEDSIKSNRKQNKKFMVNDMEDLIEFNKKLNSYKKYLEPGDKIMYLKRTKHGYVETWWEIISKNTHFITAKRGNQTATFLYQDIKKAIKKSLKR